MSDYAILETGGKQYKVTAGALLDVELLKAEVGASVRLEQVLAVRTQDKFQIGQPLVKGAAVIAQVVKHLRGPKLINFKYKRRKGYHRKVGHRQELTRLKVVEISSNGTH